MAAADRLGIYAIAVGIATTTAASFASAETISHTRLVEFTTGVNDAAVESSSARAKCERLAGAEKNRCDAKTAIVQKHVRSEVRVDLKGGVEATALAGKNIANDSREIDIALYRAHRQLPD